MSSVDVCSYAHPSGHPTCAGVIDKSFGFDTAVEEAVRAISAAKVLLKDIYL